MTVPTFELHVLKYVNIIDPILNEKMVVQTEQKYIFHELGRMKNISNYFSMLRTPEKQKQNCQFWLLNLKLIVQITIQSMCRILNISTKPTFWYECYIKREKDARWC